MIHSWTSNAFFPLRENTQRPALSRDIGSKGENCTDNCTTVANIPGSGGRAPFNCQWLNPEHTHYSIDTPCSENWTLPMNPLGKYLRPLKPHRNHPSHHHPNRLNIQVLITFSALNGAIDNKQQTTPSRSCPKQNRTRKTQKTPPHGVH